MKCSAVFATLLCCVISVPFSAYGEEPVTQCIASFESGQVLRNNGRLQEAKKTFARCAERECPSSLQLRCGEFIDDLSKAIPSVVFAVTIDGHDAIDAHVDMDGTALIDRIDARGTEIDPGLHTFVIKVPDFPPVERKLMVREGERRKKIEVSFAHPEAADQATRPGTEAASVRKRTIPLGVWITGAVGITGLALGTTFDLIGESSRTHLNDSCSPRCSRSDVDAIRTDYLVGDIALGIGAASAITAVVWYFAYPTYESSSPSGPDRASVSVVPGINSLRVKAIF